MNLDLYRQRRARRVTRSPGASHTGLLLGGVTVNLPHQRTPELCAAVVPLWQRQTVTPIIDLIDCESLPHRNWRHPSERVAVACELTQLTAGTEFVLFSHVDVFPRRRDLIAWLRSQCSADRPVVGYEISPRTMHPGRMATEWRGMVGHTLTMIHLPTIRAACVTWAYDSAFFHFGWTAADHWDTEVTFNLCLRDAGITPHLVGHDENYKHKVDEWHGHARSYPSAVLSGAKHRDVAAKWVRDEIAQARQRVAEWDDSRELMPASHPI